MKLIKLFVILLFLTNYSYGQNITPTVDEVLKRFLRTDIPYQSDEETLNLTEIFLENKIEYLGFIGASDFSPNPKYYAVGWGGYLIENFGVDNLMSYFLGDVEGYKIGVINDSDGYSNLRRQANSTADIVARIVEGEFFFYMPIETTLKKGNRLYA